jgi:hypothetical protein
MARKLALALALLGAMAASGCAVVKQESAVQQWGIGDAMEITAKVCFTGLGDGSGEDCASGPVDAGEFQALLAVRVPEGTAGPPVVEATLEGGETVTLAHSMSYSSELEELTPAVDGLHWMGYVSPPRTFAPDPESSAPPAGPQATIAAELALGLTNGLPRQGAFRYQVVAGLRPAAPSADRDVECAADVTQETADGTICVDATETDTLTTVHEAALSDVTFTGPGAPVVVQAGRTATLPFDVAFFGSPPPLEVSGIADVGDGRITPAVATVTAPGALPISVVVPAGTAPGDYDVLATVSTGMAGRTARATLRVVAPPDTTPPPAAADTTAPELKVKPVKGQTPRRVARKGLKLRVTLSEPATVAGGLAKGKPVAKTLPEGASTLKLKLKKQPGKALRRKRKARLALELLATDAAGNATSVGRTVRVKRPR